MEDKGTDVDRSEVETWIEKAGEDLHSARNNLPDGPYSNACYDSQQAAEKAVKALLIFEGKFVRKHEISDELDGLIQTAGEEVSEQLERVMDALLIVEPYWKTARYPAEGRKGPADLDQEDAEEALEKAEFILTKVKKILKEEYGM